MSILLGLLMANENLEIRFLGTSRYICALGSPRRYKNQVWGLLLRDRLFLQYCQGCDRIVRPDQESSACSLLRHSPAPDCTSERSFQSTSGSQEQGYCYIKHQRGLVLLLLGKENGHSTQHTAPLPQDWLGRGTRELSGVTETFYVLIEM